MCIYVSRLTLKKLLIKEVKIGEAELKLND
jgi:hypothetical protein